MRNGTLVGGGIVLTSLLAGAAIWYLQLFGYYHEASFTPGEEIRLTPIIGDAPEVILAEDVRGIDADSSPLRFRACFSTPLSQAMLTETYRIYEEPVPLVAPYWFDCFDAEAIGKALENGEALAFLSEAGIAPGVDRVVAVFADGRAYAWHQLADGAK